MKKVTQKKIISLKKNYGLSETEVRNAADLLSKDIVVTFSHQGFKVFLKKIENFIYVKEDRKPQARAYSIDL